MIDINELRRLAQAATSGEWYVERGNHICGRIEVTDGEEEWHPVIACTDDDETNVDFEANAAFIAAANPTAISELLDRLEAAEKERDHEKWLRERAEDYAKAVEEQREALRARIAKMEKQEPVAWMDRHGTLYNTVSHVRASDKPLYLAPGAQTQGERNEELQRRVG